MRKRFALIMAGSLVAVLIAASAALSLGLVGASPAVSGDPTAPRVRTIHHTITVHRKANPNPRSVVLAAGSDSGAPSTGGEAEPEFEDDGGSSGGHETEAFDD